MLKTVISALNEVEGINIREPSRMVADAFARMFEKMSCGSSLYDYLRCLIDFTEGHVMELSLSVITWLHPDYNVQTWLRGITNNFVILMDNIGASSSCNDDEALRLYLHLTHALMFYMKVEEMIPEDNLAETKNFLEQCKNLKSFRNAQYQSCFEFSINFVDIFAGQIGDAEIGRVLDNLS